MSDVMIEQWIESAVILMAFLWLGLYTLSLSKKLKLLSRQHQQQIERIQRELSAMNSAAIGVGQRLISAEKKLKSAAAAEPIQRKDDFDSDPLDAAASVAGRGVSAQELVDRYGLSEAEANLLSLLKRQGAEQGLPA